MKDAFCSFGASIPIPYDPLTLVGKETWMAKYDLPSTHIFVSNMPVLYNTHKAELYTCLAHDTDRMVRSAYKEILPVPLSQNVSIKYSTRIKRGIPFAIPEGWEVGIFSRSVFRFKQSHCYQGVTYPRSKFIPTSGGHNAVFFAASPLDPTIKKVKVIDVLYLNGVDYTGLTASERVKIDIRKAHGRIKSDICYSNGMTYTIPDAPLTSMWYPVKRDLNSIKAVVCLDGILVPYAIGNTLIDILTGNLCDTRLNALDNAAICDVFFSREGKVVTIHSIERGTDLSSVFYNGDIRFGRIERFRPDYFSIERWRKRRKDYGKNDREETQVKWNPVAEQVYRGIQAELR